MGRKKGAVFEDVKDIMISQTGSKEGKHVKILAKVKLTQPLLRGTTVRCQGNRVWVKFKCEKCPDFCYKCGKVRHVWRTCIEEVNLEVGKDIEQYGNWMKANFSRMLPRSKEKTPDFKVNQDISPNAGQSLTGRGLVFYQEKSQIGKAIEESNGKKV